MPSGKRIRILCEDRRTERFLRRLCRRYDIHVLESNVAPSGRGDASVWVKQHYPASVRLLRARNYQQNLSLLVAIDGDNKGVRARKDELADELENSNMPPREEDEAVAIFVPTWSIETWLAFLCDRPGVTESQPLKEHAEFRQLWEDGKSEAATISRAVEAWRGAAAPLPALADAYVEAVRVGL
jgi:hypothetical protein